MIGVCIVVILIAFAVLCFVFIFLSPKVDKKFNGVWVRKKTKQREQQYKRDEEKHIFSYFANKAEYKIDGKKVPIKFNKWIGVLILHPNTGFSEVYLLKKRNGLIWAEGENEIAIFQKSD